MTLTTAIEKIRVTLSNHHLNEDAQRENDRLAPTIEKLLRVIEMLERQRNEALIGGYGEFRDDIAEADLAVIKILEGE